MKLSRWTNNLFLSILYNHILFYPTPKNLNYFWSFGALSGLCLILQILTGLFLSMHYVPEINFAFLSIEHITRDVNYGWLLRYLHSNGASMFFIVIFFHIFRNLYFGSFLKPRIYLWFSGIIIFFLIMATAFMGYVLPWGQMSFWGATVITNLFSAIPIYGLTIVEWLWGGFSVDQATLNRFYSLHFFLPFIISAIVFLHLGLLHEVGSSDSVSLDSNKNFIHPAPVTFFPYFFVKDLLAFFVSLLIFFIFVFFIPNTLGHPDNYINANSMVTPAHIVPEWYFLPFYAILRSVPNKLGGVIAMLFAILGWFFLPLFTPKYKSPKFKLFFSIILWLFLGNFIILGWIGQQPVESPFSTIGMFSTIIYFLILFFVLPCLFLLDSNTVLDKNKFKSYILKTSSYGLSFPLEYLPFEIEIIFYVSLAISLYLNASWATDIYSQRASGNIPVTIDQHYEKILEEVLEYNRNLLPGEMPREMPLYIDITQLPLEQWPIQHLIFFVAWNIGMGMAIGYFILVVLDDFGIITLDNFYAAENTKSIPSKEMLDLEKIDLSKPQDVDLHSITNLSKSLNNIDLGVEDTKINFFSSTYQIIIDIYNYFFN